MKLEFPSPQLTVVYFYPKDATPGCTKEACAFRDVWSEYERQNVRVIGVSNDDVDSHRSFATEHRLPFPLVADADGEWARTFGVPQFAGFYSRVSFLVGQDGRVLRTYRDVDPGLHAREILQDAAAYAPALANQGSPASPSPGDLLLAPAPRPTLNVKPSVHLSVQIGSISEADSDAWLVVELTPPPGAHLYWKHPGESGLATRVDVYAPPGLQVGPVSYPGPVRLLGETGRNSFGYRGATVILAKLTQDVNSQPAFDPSRSAPTIQVHGSWLSCDSRCVKEESTQSITWNRPAKPLPQLREWLSRIPVDGDALGFRGLVDHRLEGIRITAPHPWLVEDAFPEQDFPPGERLPVLVVDGSGARLQPLIRPLPSTLVVQARGALREVGYFTVHVVSE